MWQRVNNQAFYSSWTSFLTIDPQEQQFNQQLKLNQQQQFNQQLEQQLIAAKLLFLL